MLSLLCCQSPALDLTVRWLSDGSCESTYRCRSCGYEWTSTLSVATCTDGPPAVTVTNASVEYDEPPDWYSPDGS